MTPSPEYAERLVAEYAAHLVRNPVVSEANIQDALREFTAKLLDDPASAPVGQVRQFQTPQARVLLVVKTDRTTTPPWAVVGGNRPGDQHERSNYDVVGWSVVGSVPHTPANRVPVHRDGVVQE